MRTTTTPAAGLASSAARPLIGSPASSPSSILRPGCLDRLSAPTPRLHAPSRLPPASHSSTPMPWLHPYSSAGVPIRHQEPDPLLLDASALPVLSLPRSLSDPTSRKGRRRELQFRLPWKPPLSSSSMASSPSAASQKNKQEDIDTRGAQRLCPSLLRTFWLHPDARVCSDISPAGIPVRHQALDLAPMPRAMDLAPSQLHHPSRPPLAFHDIGCIIHFGRLRPSPDPTPGSSLASTVFS